MCYASVARLLQDCYKIVPEYLIAILLQDCFKIVSTYICNMYSYFHKRNASVARLFLNDCNFIVELLQDCCFSFKYNKYCVPNL